MLRLPEFLLFDIETTLIPSPNVLPDTVHMLAYTDARDPNGKVETITDQRGMREFWAAVIDQHPVVVGHNMARFDLPVMERFGGAKFDGEIIDTLVWSRMYHLATIYGWSVAKARSAGPLLADQERLFPAGLRRKHSLEAWGYRLGLRKLVHHVTNPREFFAGLSAEMIEYCRGDVHLNRLLYLWLASHPARPGWPKPSHRLVQRESHLAYIISHMERNGIGFDVAEARRLYMDLAAERETLKTKLQRRFPRWWKASPGQKATALCQEGDYPYTEYKSVRNYTKGKPWPQSVGGVATKVEQVTFNPGSSPHRYQALKRKYGWKPKPDQYTKEGAPETSERVLQALDYPEVPTLLRYLWVSKRLGQLAEGQFSWLEMERNGVIRGSCTTTGTRTSRPSHQAPNLAQVPSEAAFRKLFRPTREGWWQVGADASGLELRMLGHRLAYYDGGAAAKLIVEGDIHSRFMEETKITDRSMQKRFTYAMLYGAGDPKLGEILIADAAKAGNPIDPKYAAAMGAAAKEQLLRGFPALNRLLTAVADAWYDKRWIRGLDGRPIPMASEHGGLNDVLQSDGIIVMKYAIAHFWDTAGWGRYHGDGWGFMAWPHDEIQAEAVDEATAQAIGEDFVASIRQAGENLGVRCPLDGEFKIGKTWADTH